MWSFEFCELLLVGPDGSPILISEEAVEDHARIVQGGHRLAAPAEGKGAGAGGLADAAVDREAQGAEAGVRRRSWAARSWSMRRPSFSVGRL